MGSTSHFIITRVGTAAQSRICALFFLSHAFVMCEERGLFEICADKDVIRKPAYVALKSQ